MALTAACSSEPAGPEEIAAFLRSPTRDAAAFQTDRLEYTLERTDGGYRMDIAFRFTNPSGGAAYFVNCSGATGVVLEKWTDGGWTMVWAPILPACLSAPIVVASHGIWSGTVHVWAGDPGSNHYPQFETRDPEGVYRLRWEPLRTYDPNDYPFGEPLPRAQSVSNRFIVRAGS